MKWTNIRLIVSRELRDQLRDRRTIFVVAVLPLLFYPLLGMSFLQMAQFLREHPTKIWVLGAENLPPHNNLLDGDGFHESLIDSPGEQKLFQVTVSEKPPGDVAQLANEAVRTGKYDAVLYLPQELGAHVAGLQRMEGDSSREANAAANLPGPEIFFDQAKDKSRVARARVIDVLSRWRSQIVEQTLSTNSVPPAVANPFAVVSKDLSAEAGRQAALWSKILPFIIIIWAMTGAFYPAIDLCAGEKERGTLETLLSSPASRQEIVGGKLLTVMVFSIATSMLNLLSMGLTGQFVMRQLQALGGFGSFALGSPPLHTFVWLVMVLVPISALFSALSLALAAMARSTKEGQYYLMPLMLGTMPLMLLPMMPAVELDLGTSLIPVTGVTLLLRNLIEGNYGTAIRFAAPVIGVTAVCCWLAILWAIHQFQDENVLFHESEQFDLRSWLRHLIRHRGPIPTVGQAFLCAVLILLMRFGATMTLQLATDWGSFVRQTVMLQVGLIALPPILMAFVLTRSVRLSLLWKLPSVSHVIAAILLACFLHPVATGLAVQVHTLYPISEQTLAQMKPLQATLGQAASHWQLLALLALLPAICEELAFRGFVLSGLRRMKSAPLAILVSSLFFGVAHQVLQQSLTAFALGLVIGYLAIRTESIFPCMCFHLIHNSLQLSSGQWANTPPRWLAGFVEIRDPGLIVYDWRIVTLGAIGAFAVLAWLSFRQQPRVDRPAPWRTQEFVGAA